MRKNNSYAIVVLSCDKYSDLWKPFFLQFFTYWSDCPYPVYLGSNTKKYSDSRVQTILSGPSLDWSTDLLRILSKIKQQHVCVWLEDLFLIEPVDTKSFIECFTFMQQHNAAHIHLMPAIKPDKITDGGSFGIYDKNSPYRVTAPGFWNKKYLEKLLIPGENPWNFEIMGSYRSSYFEGFYTHLSPVFSFIRVVDKGKIRRDAYNYCLNHGIQLDLTNRKVFGLYDKLLSDIQGTIFKFMISIPWHVRLNITNVIRRLLVTY